MKKITIIIPLGENRDFVASESINEHKNKINFIVQRGANPSQNRNRGIKKAKTNFIGFINGHTTIANDWNEKAIKFFENYPKIDIVGGPQLTPKEDNSFAKISGYALSSIFGAGEVRYRYKMKQTVLDANEKYVTSSNLICKKKVFKEVLFDEDLWPGEDPKFISDAIKKGFKVAYFPEIITYNRRRNSLSGLAKQIFSYGLNRPKKERLIETMKKPFFLAPSLFILYLAFLPTLFLISGYFLYPPLLYAGLNVLFSFYSSLKNKDFFALFLLPFLFLTIHLSYGLGFFYGLFNRNERR